MALHFKKFSVKTQLFLKILRKPAVNMNCVGFRGEESSNLYFLINSESLSCIHLNLQLTLVFKVRVYRV